MLDWIRDQSRNSDVTMSVCTGAFVLAKTGLLDGQSATTFHGAFGPFAMMFPKNRTKRGDVLPDNGISPRLVDSSGSISAARLSVTTGRDVATKTAYNLEYQGEGWKNSDSNSVYAVRAISTPEHPLCPVCEMDVDAKTAPKLVYKGATYFFCDEDEKKPFKADPAKLLSSQ